MGGNADGTPQSQMPAMGPWATTQPTTSDVSWSTQNTHVVHSLITTFSQSKMYWYDAILDKSRQLFPKTVISDWQSMARDKRDSVNELIPQEWRLDSIPPINEQKDVTGDYIQQFLSPREIQITETDAVGIVEKTQSGEWKAREVCEAFCHRAALAHQLVGISKFLSSIKMLNFFI